MRRDAEDRGMTRRGFAAVGAAGVAAGLIPDWVGADASSEEPFTSSAGGGRLPRPNILFIMADDLGWADLSAYGSPHIRTPNLDRLAASGIRFTNGYSASANCSPTRFSLYTGRYPGRLAGGLPEPINAPSPQHGIPLDHPTLASLLRGRGYHTAMIGKWHCGYLPHFSPTRLGWDEFFGNFGGGLDYFSKLNTLGQYDLYENEVEHKDLRYYTHVITERAERFVRRQKDRPWLLNLNYTTPHWPWEGPRDKDVSRELTGRIRAGAGGTATLVHTDGGSIETYREMVEDLDQAVGRVIRALDRTDARRETLVIFTSDNGGERFSNTWPFSGEKRMLREGGLRVPLLVSWPGWLKRKQVSHAPVVTHDWTATLLELGGARPDRNYPLDGVSLVDYLFHGARPPRRDLFWRMSDGRALRRGALKYFRDPDGFDFLYDLGADVREQANVGVKRPDDLAALTAAWEAIDATLLPYPAGVIKLRSSVVRPWR